LPGPDGGGPGLGTPASRSLRRPEVLQVPVQVTQNLMNRIACYVRTATGGSLGPIWRYESRLAKPERISHSPQPGAGCSDPIMCRPPSHGQSRSESESVELPAPGSSGSRKPGRPSAAAAPADEELFTKRQLRPSSQPEPGKGATRRSCSTKFSDGPFSESRPIFLCTASEPFQVNQPRYGHGALYIRVFAETEFSINTDGF
jgi:hypothetical protein